MNVDDFSDAKAMMLRFECDYCGAIAGQWCLTKGGHRSVHLHSARYYRWREVANSGS